MKTERVTDVVSHVRNRAADWDFSVYQFGVGEAIAGATEVLRIELTPDEHREACCELLYS